MGDGIRERTDLELAFVDPNIGDRVETLAPAAIDALPFGVILLDRRNNVLMINSVERSQGGLGDSAIGENYFEAVAPQFDGADFRGRIDNELTRRGDLDGQADPLALAFDVHADDMPDKSVTVRVQGATQGGLWVFLDRSRR